MISYEYIRGLVEGEGCLTFTTTKQVYKKLELIINWKIPAFAIAMHERDENLLIMVRDRLGLRNRVYNHKQNIKDGYNRGRKAFLIVREVDQLKDIIIPLFYKRLLGNKGKQFLMWMERIGNDPDVPQRYKSIYGIYKSGFYDSENKFDHCPIRSP